MARRAGGPDSSSTTTTPVACKVDGSACPGGMKRMRLRGVAAGTTVRGRGPASDIRGLNEASFPSSVERRLKDRGRPGDTAPREDEIGGRLCRPPQVVSPTAWLASRRKAKPPLKVRRPLARGLARDRAILAILRGQGLGGRSVR